MRTNPVATALILIVLALPALPAAVPQAPEHLSEDTDSVALPGPDEDAPHAHLSGRFTGTGLAHGSNETLGFHTADITQNWTLIDGHAVVATVVSDTYRLVCHDGTAHVTHTNGTIATHACSLLGDRSTANVSVVVSDAQGRPALDTHVTIDEENSTIHQLGAANEPPNPWPGFVVTLLAVLFASATAAMAWLYVSERRISRYLVRRLFEETRGHVPKEWPEHLRRRVIARFVVGGKN